MIPLPMKDLTAALQAAWLHRKEYILSRRIEAFRLVNGAVDSLEGLTVDFYAGSYLVTFQNEALLASKGKLLEGLKKLHPQIPGESPPNFLWFKNFAGKAFEYLSPNIEIKNIREGELRFEVRLGDSRHTGLFLDQRENRETVRKQAKKKKVLNLFCYTGAFTIAALHGGAKEVQSVDLSKNALKWLTRNLALNELGEEKSHLYPMDVFAFLKNRLAEEERFDLILLDPPTFSRSKTGNFSTEKNLAELAQSCSRLLGEGGHFFLSLNTRKINAERFFEILRLALQGTGLKAGKLLPLPLDFRLSPEERKNPYLKACWIS